MIIKGSRPNESEMELQIWPMKANFGHCYINSVSQVLLGFSPFEDKEALPNDAHLEQF